jgi:putative transcriptional regulator
MTTAYDDIRIGLSEAIDFAEDRLEGATVNKPHDVDVRKVRQGLGMTQERFAASFGIGLGTLRHWERGDRRPRGPALALLNVVEKKPEAVLEALAEKA